MCNSASNHVSSCCKCRQSLPFVKGKPPPQEVPFLQLGVWKRNASNVTPTASTCPTCLGSGKAGCRRRRQGGRSYCCCCCALLQTANYLTGESNQATDDLSVGSLPSIQIAGTDTQGLQKQWCFESTIQTLGLGGDIGDQFCRTADKRFQLTGHLLEI